MQDCNFKWADGTPFKYDKDINGKINGAFDYNNARETGARFIEGGLKDTAPDYQNKYKPLCQKCHGGGESVLKSSFMSIRGGRGLLTNFIYNNLNYEKLIQIIYI